MTNTLQIIGPTSLEIVDTPSFTDNIFICNATFQNFHKICRFCLSFDNVIPFLDMTYEQLPVRSIIFDFSSLMIQPDDPLPCNLCSACLSEFIRWYKFKRRCIKTTSILHNAYINRNCNDSNSTGSNSECYGESYDMKIKKEEIDDTDILENANNDDLIIKYEEIQNLVLKGDGFPVNICNICLEKLNLIFAFKEMVMQSNMKLQRAYHTKVRESCQNRTSDTFFKEENLFIKNENVDSLLDLNIIPDTANSLQNTMLETETIISNLQTENNLDLLQNKTYVVEKPLALKDNHILTIDTDVTVKEERNKCTKNGEETVLCNNEIVSDNLNKCLIVSEQPTTCLDNSSVDDENQIEPENIEGSSSPRKRQKKERAKYNNETQLEMLDNSEYLKLKQMGLSKKEKDRATILCKECNRTFNFRYYIAVHIHVHTGNLPYKCDLCELKFPKENRLNQHRRVHFQTKEVACDECGMAFFNIHHLKSHKAKHSDERPHKCSTCEKAFKFSAALKKHELIHQKDKNFMCEECGKTFTESAGLSHHKVIHTAEERSFVCKTCGKTFARKKALGRHVKRHTSEKLYICNYCGKSFRDSAVLRNHVLIHTDTKPFACEVCGKTFRQRSCIPRHMRIHTGETPYPCGLCQSSFKYSHHLLNHMKVHEVSG